MRDLSENFMRHFRWLTPLLLALSIYLLQDIYLDFKKLKEELTSVRIDMAILKTVQSKRILPDNR